MSSADDVLTLVLLVPFDRLLRVSSVDIANSLRSILRLGPSCFSYKVLMSCHASSEFDLSLKTKVEQHCLANEPHVPLLLSRRIGNPLERRELLPWQNVLVLMAEESTAEAAIVLTDV